MFISGSKVKAQEGANSKYAYKKCKQQRNRLYEPEYCRETTKMCAQKQMRQQVSFGEGEKLKIILQSKNTKN